MNQDGKNFLVAIIAGLVAAFLMFSYSQEKKAELDKELGAKKIVLVAKKNIQEFQTIDDEMVEAIEIPAQFIQPGAANSPESVIGQISAAPIAKGEQILFNKLLQSGAETGISLQVSPSKRAVAIPVDDTRAVSKLIRPGDRVDIVVAIDVGKGLQAKREVVTLLSDVPVLATGLNVVGGIPRMLEYDAASKSLIQTNLTGDTKYSTITVEVNPKEAQDLIYILSTSPSNIFFTLRNPADKAPLGRLPSSSSEVLSVGFGAVTPNSGSTPINIPPQYQGGSGR
jgi:pilus assembly protein CpaB